MGSLGERQTAAAKEGDLVSAGASGNGDVSREPVGAGGGEYILLIDDEETILDVLVALLRDDEGYEVYTARSGEEALHVAPPAAPGLILMDLSLPDGDPKDLAQRLRSRPGWQDVALVICSGAERLREEADRLGATDCLPKPFGLTDVTDLVERLGLPHRQRDNI
jgi:CheY-like chemotaxis protein